MVHGENHTAVHICKIMLNKSQGSYGSWKTWKVMEFCNFVFQAWKVIEKIIDVYGEKSLRKHFIRE